MKLPADNQCNKLEASASCVSGTSGTTGARDVDYSEYVWMGEEMEEFDRECIEQILEDDFIETCFEEMLEEEDEVYEFIQMMVEQNKDMDPELVIEQLKAVALSNNVELTFLEDPTKCIHRLNPEAPEFIPSPALVSPHVEETHHDR